MEQMQIAINISNSTITDLKKKQNRTEVDNAVLNGTVLPEHHGRLIDADALNEAYTYECISECDRCEHCSKDGHGCELLLNAPTIIEADTKSEE